LILWNIVTGAFEKTLKLKGSVEALELLPNGEIACLTLCGLYFWNPDSDSLGYAVVIASEDITQDTNLYMIQLASGDLCVCCNESQDITIFDFKTHQKIKTIPTEWVLNPSGTRAMTLLRDGRLAVGICFEEDDYSDDDDADDDVILIYNLETGACEQTLVDSNAKHMVQLSDGRLYSCGESYGRSEFSVWY
jgi:hypothetical protein